MSDEPLSPGDLISVVSGNFVNYRGVVLAEADAKKMGGQVSPPATDDTGLWVSLGIYGRQVILKLPDDCIERRKL
jgi:hypothetical protein